MNSSLPRIPVEYVVPLNMNGLRGRMLRLPAPAGRRREMLLVYGHHASLERMYGLAAALNRYGGVTLPDLPGFGGMDSLYKIKEKPSLDTLADYLAAVVKLRYRNKRLTIVGFSFGFTVVTRMLQRYPELGRQVDAVVSLSGFARYDDFRFKPLRHRIYLAGARLFTVPLPSWLFRSIALHPWVIKRLYHRMYNARDKFAGLSRTERAAISEFEVRLWRENDIRTHMATTAGMLTLDNCRVQIPAPVWHVAVENDKYFNNDVVEQHLRVIFSDVHMLRADTHQHAPTVIADEQAAGSMLPRRLRKMLERDTPVRTAASK